MSSEQLEKRIERIKQELLKIGPMRPGTLSRQTPPARNRATLVSTAKAEEARTPFYQLSYSHQGKSTTRFVRPGYVAKIRKELAAYKRFRGLTQEWLTLALTSHSCAWNRRSANSTSSRELGTLKYDRVCFF
jgi:hypothetical protein